MKIALIGEYSSLHNNLAKALKEKGHSVLLVNDGDYVKNYYRDINIRGNGSNKYFKLLSRIWKEIKLIFIIKNYDIVQYINPSIFSQYTPSKIIFLFIKKNNKKIFLLAAGDDYYFWNAYRKNKYKYSAHEAYLKKDIKETKSPWEKYRLRSLTFFLSNRVNGIIPTSIVYQIAYNGHENCKKMINFPIECKKNNFIESKNIKKDSIIILHGVQTARQGFKGTDLIDSAIKVILNKYPQKVEYIRVVDMPYEHYLKKIAEADIIIDQVYSYEPAMNALISMQMGKLVLGGYEEELKNINNIDYEPLINIIPSVEDIISKLEKIINNPEIIQQYGENAKKYVKRFHDSNLIAEEYLTVWKST